MALRHKLSVNNAVGFKKKKKKKRDINSRSVETLAFRMFVPLRVSAEGLVCTTA